MKLPRVGLVGLGGYGAVHLQHLRDFHRQGEITLVAAVAFPPDGDAAVVAQLRGEDGCEIFSSFDEMVVALPRLKLDLVIVPTPIHLHARMTIALAWAGVDVLVEKPLAAIPEEAKAIAKAANQSGRMVAVGFQYLHAPEVRALKKKLISGAIGPLRRLVVHATWPRSHAYYTRNAWAGRLKVGSDSVFDSPVSNAMSHFMMVMLFLAGREMEELAHPVQLAAELYRAQAIESFDTAAIRLETAEGLKLDFYGTHSSREICRPTLKIEGANGSAEWVQDSHAQVMAPAGDWKLNAGPESTTREQMLRDVLARRRGEAAFVCTPEMAAVHVACVAELHRHSTIHAIPEKQLSQYFSYGQNFTYVPGLDRQLLDAAQGGVSLAEAGASWAVPATPLRNYAV